MSIAAAALAILAIGILAVSAACDARAHVLPYGLSFSLYPVGAAFQLCLGGAEAAFGAVVCAGLILAVFVLASKIFKSRHAIDPVGMGDMRTAPAVALLSGMDGTPLGLAACCLSMAAVVGLSALRGRVGRRTQVAMGPYLALWGLVGIAASFRAAG